MEELTLNDKVKQIIKLNDLFTAISEQIRLLEGDKVVLGTSERIKRECPEMYEDLRGLQLAFHKREQIRVKYEMEELVK